MSKNVCILVCNSKTIFLNILSAAVKRKQAVSEKTAGCIFSFKRNYLQFINHNIIRKTSKVLTNANLGSLLAPPVFSNFCSKSTNTII